MSMWSATMPASPPAGGIDNISLDNWRWVLDVNLMGVLHGIRTFLPHIRGHGEGGHIVNTASMAGMNGGLGFSPYTASKFAVVGMSEGLAHAAQAARHRRQRAVSGLCPHPHRRERAQPAGSAMARRRRWIPPARRRRMVAEIARQICRPGSTRRRSPPGCLPRSANDELYVFTHPEMRAEQWTMRFAAIQAAMD